MSVETPVWIVLVPLVLLMVFAAIGVGGFLLQKWLRAQPEAAAGAIKFAALLGFGLLGFFMLCALFVGIRSSAPVVEYSATEFEPPIVQPPIEAEVVHLLRHAVAAVAVGFENGLNIPAKIDS